MSELFTYGSVGGAGGNPGSYPENRAAGIMLPYPIPSRARKMRHLLNRIVPGSTPSAWVVCVLRHGPGGVAPG